MSKIMITSGFNFEGYIIKKYYGFCSGECVLGTGFLSSIGAGMADILGINSTKYENKLSKAKSMAISELEKSAMELGANAIIGLDVDYNTFSSDIMGVVANGTAVQIEKIVDNETVESIKAFNIEMEAHGNDYVIDFPVISYYENIDIRPFNITYYMKTKEICISVYRFKDIQLNALNVDIIGNTIFGTTYKYTDINFTHYKLEDGIIKTEKVILDIPINQLKVIQSFTVKIQHYILSGELFTLSGECKMSTMNIDELLDFRKLYGKDVVCDFRDNPNGWTCMCGNKNMEDTNVCSYCGRSKKVYSKISKSRVIKFGELLPDLEGLQNCREIVDYLMKIENEQGYRFPEKEMNEIRKMAGLEKMYGNMKSSMISNIKKYIAENE